MKRRDFLKMATVIPALPGAAVTSKNQHEYFGSFVDLSKEQTLEILKTSELRWSMGPKTGPYSWPKVHVMYYGNWWDIGYTTLTDDVGVGIGLPRPNWHENEDRSGLYNDCSYGARLRTHPDRRDFMLVRCVSDG